MIHDLIVGAINCLYLLVLMHYALTLWQYMVRYLRQQLVQQPQRKLFTCEYLRLDLV